MGVDKQRRPVLVPSLTVDPETVEHSLSLAEARIHDAPKTFLPDAATEDDCGLANAEEAVLKSRTANNNQVVGYALWYFTLPANYKTGSDFVLRVHTRTTVLAGTHDRINSYVKKIHKDQTLGGDIVSTGHYDGLTTVMLDYDFNVHGGTLLPGNELQIMLQLDRNDVGGANAGHIEVGRVSLRYSSADVNAA